MTLAFGKTIAAERKRLGLSQKDLASRVVRDDGASISPQYLNDIERNRRNPPSEEIITKIAEVLQLEPEWLFFLAGQMPPDLRDGSRSREQVRDAFVAFRTALDTSGSQRR